MQILLLINKKALPDPNIDPKRTIKIPPSAMPCSRRAGEVSGGDEEGVR